MSRTLVRIQGNQRTVLSTDLQIANTFASRSKGLLGRSTFDAGQGLMIESCTSIHTCFMRFPIDAVFVDKNLRVVSIYHELKPWRITRIHLGASTVIELPAGTLAKVGEIAKGDILKIEAEGADA